MLYYVYIMANKSDTVIYTGITSDLKKRVYEHKSDVNEGFTKRYHVHKLVYFETYHSPMDAIRREKQIKSWSRQRKNELIESQNPTWKELGNWQ